MNFLSPVSPTRLAEPVEAMLSFFDVIKGKAVLRQAQDGGRFCDKSFGILAWQTR
jgi:hypothetical protein